MPGARKPPPPRPATDRDALRLSLAARVAWSFLRTSSLFGSALAAASRSETARSYWCICSYARARRSSAGLKSGASLSAWEHSATAWRYMFCMR